MSHQRHPAERSLRDQLRELFAMLEKAGISGGLEDMHERLRRLEAQLEEEPHPVSGDAGERAAHVK